jgi:hypothetical protein
MATFMRASLDVVLCASSTVCSFVVFIGSTATDIFFFSFLDVVLEVSPLFVGHCRVFRISVHTWSVFKTVLAQLCYVQGFTELHGEEVFFVFFVFEGCHPCRLQVVAESHECFSFFGLDFS